MQFDWDEHNTRHILRHGMKPQDAEHAVTHNPVRVSRELRNGEERITFAGRDTLGSILVVTVTSRSKKLRDVTAFPASLKIRAWYRSLRGTEQ